MFKNILLPLDLTDKHQQAFAVAADLAKQSGGRTVLLHVVETIPGLAEDEEKGFYSRLDRTAQTHLKKLATSLLSQGIPCETKVMLGHRVRDTAAYARQIEADLIILSVPPFNPEHPIEGWGSMSWKISLMAPCPILLMK